MSVSGFDPSLQSQRGQVPGGYGFVPPSKQRRIPPKPQPQVQPPAKKEGKGIIGYFFDTVAWMISWLHDLIFSCFVNEKNETEEDQARGWMIPIVLDRWFLKYPKLGKHLEAAELIKDLNALPEAVFHAINYAFFNGTLLKVSVEDFVNSFVMMVDTAIEIKDGSVIESLNKLSQEEFAKVRVAFFAEKDDPGPLSVEAFVRGHVMKQKFGNRLHAGHLTEDLMGLPRNILKEVYTSFFQGKHHPLDLDELSVGAFVNGYIVRQRGAMAQLEVALRLQTH
eukprot:Platyproteum_vivax@DN15920_c0_g1_i1.p1